MLPQFQPYDSRTDLDISLARDIAQALARAIAERGEASLALSGGSTPVGMFQQLRQIDIDWAKVTITLVDDRWLPANHRDSNEGMLRKHLLVHRLQDVRLLSLVADAPSPELGLPEVEARLSALPFPFDVAILGMGEDGHTASLFPCASELEAACALDKSERLAAVNPGTAPYARISFSLAALIQSRQLWLHITGDKKHTIFTQAMQNASLPIARVLNAAQGNTQIYWAP